MSLKNKKVLITGSGDGIGKTIALRFAKEKACLMLCDIRQENLDKTVAEIRAQGVEAYGIQYNAAKPEDVEKVFNEMIVHYGDIDVLVNNVGIAGPTAPVQDIELADWDSTFEINVRATFHMIKLATPYMIAKNAGKIVNMSSMSGKHALLNRAPYCASKMGIIGLTRCVARELGAHNINVNCVCPSNIDNARGTAVMQKQAEVKGIAIEDVLQKYLEPYCLKRRIPMEHVAEMVAFLSDDEKSSSITGQDINVTCGAYV